MIGFCERTRRFRGSSGTPRTASGSAFARIGPRPRWRKRRCGARCQRRHAIQKQIRDTKLSRLKTLEEFDFHLAPQIPAAKIRALAKGGSIDRAQPVARRGECGTGTTHRATGWCVAACQQKRRTRFATAANLVNEPVEARPEKSP